MCLPTLKSQAVSEMAAAAMATTVAMDVLYLNAWWRKHLAAAVAVAANRDMVLCNYAKASPQPCGVVTLEVVRGIQIGAWSCDRARRKEQGLQDIIQM